MLITLKSLFSSLSSVANILCPSILSLFLDVLPPTSYLVQHVSLKPSVCPMTQSSQPTSALLCSMLLTVIMH